MPRDRWIYTAEGEGLELCSGNRLVVVTTPADPSPDSTAAQEENPGVVMYVGPDGGQVSVESFSSTEEATAFIRRMVTLALGGIDVTQV